jgi:site-specific recombinase XerD
MPIPSNQAFNRSLKLLMAEIGINKKICSHSGRYTFASTVLLGNGVRIETAQRLLAHKSIKSTMIYGKLSDATLIDEVSQLRLKLG